jgi:hypothetical protein
MNTVIRFHIRQRTYWFATQKPASEEELSAKSSYSCILLAHYFLFMVMLKNFISRAFRK